MSKLSLRKSTGLLKVTQLVTIGLVQEPSPRSFAKIISLCHGIAFLAGILATGKERRTQKAMWIEEKLSHVTIPQFTICKMGKIINSARLLWLLRGWKDPIHRKLMVQNLTQEKVQ